MKRKYTIIILFIIIAAVLTVAIKYNKPYKPTSFVIDGEIFSATVENGDTMLLDLQNDNKQTEWSITQTPECYTSDYSNVTQDVTEFHIIALDDGEGVMGFQCVTQSGTVKNYELTLSISRHQKTYFQIDSASFVEVKD